MSDTPRTDEWLRNAVDGHEFVEHCRELERELNAETRRLDWVMKTLALNALPLDEWDRDNIDDGMDREGAE